MKQLLKWEEIGEFLFAVFMFSQLDFAWWWFPALLLLPDLSMVGYLAGPRAGAWSYNFFHHKMLGLALWAAGIFLKHESWAYGEEVVLAGIILFAHSAMDRIFGYGLKYETGFTDTHLGKIGKGKTE